MCKLEIFRLRFELSRGYKIINVKVFGMVELNTKIQPLVEDLRAALSGEFLTSTEYKRWLVEKDLDETWAQCVAYVKGERRYIMIGFNHDASDAKDALGVILNLIFEHQRKQLPAFILDLLLVLMR